MGANEFLMSLLAPRMGTDGSGMGFGTSPLGPSPMSTPPFVNPSMRGASSPMQAPANGGGGNFYDMVNSMLQQYGLHAGTSQNLLLPEPGTSGFFGQHPNLSRGIESALVGAASARPGLTVGDSISSIASSILGTPQLRQQMLMQRNVGMPMQYAQQMMGFQQEQAKIEAEKAQAAYMQAHANYFNNYSRKRFSGQPYPVAGPNGTNVYAQTDDVTGQAVLQTDAQGNPMQVPSGFRGTGKSNVMPGSIRTENERQAFTSMDPYKQELLRNYFATGESDPDTQKVLGEYNSRISSIGATKAGQRAGATTDASRKAAINNGDVPEDDNKRLKSIDEDYTNTVANFPKYDDWMLSQIMADKDSSNEAYMKARQAHISQAAAARDAAKSGILNRPPRVKAQKTSLQTMVPNASSSQPSPSKPIKITTKRGTTLEF